MSNNLLTRLAFAAGAFGLCTALIATGGVHARPDPHRPLGMGHLAGISGAGVSAIELVNLDQKPMAAALTFHRQGGGAVTRLEASAVRALGSVSYYLPTESSLANGAYAVAADADRPYGLITRGSWPATGAAVVHGASRPGLQVDVPVWRSAGGLTSLVSIQNMDPVRIVAVAARIQPPGSPTALVDSSFNIQPGESITLDLLEDPAFASLPLATIALLRLSAPSPIAVQTLVDVESSPQGVFGLALTPADRAQTSWYAPRVRADDPADAGDGIERHDSQVLVVNSGETDVAVTLSYHGSSGACAGQTIVHGAGAVQVPAGGMQVFRQYAPLADGTVGESHLPVPCSAAAALQASGPVTAYVVDLSHSALTDQPSAAAAYTAAAADQGVGDQLLVPLWRNHQTSALLTSDLTLMNPGSAPARVIVALFDEDFHFLPCDETCEFWLGPGAATLLRPEDMGRFLGQSAVALIESNQRLVALIEDVSRNHLVDATADLALAIDAPAFGAGEAAALPRVLRGQSETVPSRTPSDATPSPRTPTAPKQWSVFGIGFVDVAGGTDPACPGCNGRLDPEDEAFAAGQPLPTYELRLLASDGREVARTTTEPLASLQRGQMDAPPLAAGDYYRLEIVATPASWHVCEGVSDSGLLRPEDFQLGAVRVDFFFHRQTCPPIQATATPSSGGPAPTLSAPAPKLQGSTGFMARHSGPAPADIDFLFADGEGKRTDIEHFGIQADRTTSVYLGSGIVPDGSYSALVSSVSPIGVSSATVWGDAWAAFDAAVPGTDLVVPLAAKGPLGLNTWLAIQNLDAAAPAQVALTALRPDGGTVAQASYLVPAGATRGIDLGRDPALTAIGLDFVGSLRIRAATRLAIQAVLDFENSRLAIAGLNGEPVVAAAPTLFIPRVLGQVFADPRQPAAGSALTRLAIANPGGAGATVTVRYLGSAGACEGQAFTGQVRLVPAGGLAWFDVRSDGLPAGCAASAIIGAGDGAGLLAASLDTVQAGDVLRTAAAYNAFGAAQAGRRIGLPAVRRLLVDVSSELTVQNLGDAPVTFDLTVVDKDGRPVACGSACRATLAVGASRTIVGEEIEGMNAGQYGSGLVEASGPVAVQVAEVSRTLRVDQSGYAGQAEAAPGAGALEPLAFPLALAKAGLRLPGPPLTPYEPPRFEPPDGSILSGLARLPTLFLPHLASRQR